MNLTLHLIRKDLRQFRLPALFWAGFVAAQILFTNWLLVPDTSNPNWYLMMSMFVNLLYFLGLVFSYLFAGMIVLADPPASSVAQWPTRPISGGRLLAAKTVVGLLIVGAIPILLWLPWWIYCGFGLRDLAGSAALVATVTLIPAVVGAALAALVDQAARFAMLGMILGAALIVFAITALVPQEISPTLFGTRLILDLVCFVGAALAALVVQYLTRKTPASAVVLAAGVAVVLFVRAWWPVDLMEQIGAFLPWGQSREILAGTEKVTGRVWYAEFGSRNNKDGIAEPFIVVKLGLTGLPDDVFVSGGSADVELSWPDGTTVRRQDIHIGEDDWYNRWEPMQRALGFPAKLGQRFEHWDPETQAKYEANRMEAQRIQAKIEARMKGKVRAYRLPADLNSSTRLEIPVSPAIVAKARLTPPVCRIVATLRTQRPVILGETAFTRGATIAHDGRVRVAQLERVILEQKRPEWLNVEYSGGVTLAKPPFRPNSSLYFVDRTHQTVTSLLSYNTIQSVAWFGAKVSYYPIKTSPPSLWRTDRWVEQPDWQKTMTLVVEESRPAGYFIYRLTTEKLEIAEAVEP